MIDYTEFRRQIENFIEANYTGSLPVRYENTTFQAANTEHISFRDLGDIAVEPMEIGGSINVSDGAFAIEILTALGEGTEKARLVATELDTMFNIGLDNVAFRDRELKSVGEVDEAPLYQHNLIVPYRYIYGQNDST